MSYKATPLELDFLCSTFKSHDFPPDVGEEIALCGRSNSGKSSLINSLTNQSKLAKTSNTPGRTQSINFFQFSKDPSKKIVDLPGYGYAKASKSDQNAWAKLILEYLQKRESLLNLILIMDIRHPFQKKDYEFLNLCSTLNLPISLVLTKADKQSNAKIKKTLDSIKQDLDANSQINDVNVCSATKRIGVNELNKKIHLILDL